MQLINGISPFDVETRAREIYSLRERNGFAPNRYWAPTRLAF